MARTFALGAKGRGFKSRHSDLRNNLLFLFLVVIIFFIIYSLFLKKSSFLEYELEGKTYKLLIADNYSEWSKGLMFNKNKDELKGADGMMFIFPDKQIRDFWNENTYLNLDVYWLDDDKVVGKDFLPSILKTKEPYTVSSKEKVNKVIELVKE